MHANRKMSLLTPTVVKKYSCDSESRECMLNSCDTCKHGLTVDDVKNGEAKKDDSDSDSKINAVRYYRWKRGDDGYLAKSIVEADANEALGFWQSMVETLKEPIHISRGSLKRFATLQIFFKVK